MKKIYFSTIIVLLLCLSTALHCKVTLEDTSKKEASYGLGIVRETDMGMLLEEGYPKSKIKEVPPFPVDYAGKGGKSLFLYNLGGKKFKKYITFRFKFRVYPCQNENSLKELAKEQKVVVAPRAISGPQAIISNFSGFSCIFTTYQEGNETKVPESKFWIWSQENSIFSLSRKTLVPHHKSFMDNGGSVLSFYDIQDVKMTFDKKQNLTGFAINGDEFKCEINDKVNFGPSFFYGFHARKDSNLRIEVSDVEIYADEDGDSIKTLPVTPYPQYEASHYEKLANSGDPDGMYRLGMAYFDGRGTGNDYFEAVKWFRKAAEKGHVFAISMLGTCYYKGIGVDQNKAEAEKWFQSGADKFYGDAIYRLAFCRFEDEITKTGKMSDSTRILLETSMIKLNSNAMVLSGEYKRMQKNPSDPSGPLYDYASASSSETYIGAKDFQKITVPAIKKLSEYSGGFFSYDCNPKGLYGFAITLLEKQRVAKADMDTAIECLKKSAELGFIAAKEKLNSIQNNTPIPAGDKAKKEKAEKLFQDAKSQALLKTPEADREALRLFKEAAAMEYKQASYELGVCYYKGLLGLAADKKKAAEYWKKFEALENRDNMSNMIYMPLKAKYAFNGIMD